MPRPLGSKNKKSIWLLESLTRNGYDYEKMLTKFLSEAARGNQRSYAMAQLLVKMVPYLAHMPKSDAGTVQIDTLVINRLERSPVPLSEGGSPSIDAEVVNIPSQSEEK
jgi:hypothetical protein